MANLTSAEARSLSDRIAANPFTYEDKIYSRLSEFCPQIAWHFRKLKAKELVRELVPKLLLVQGRDGAAGLAPPAVDFLNANMLLFQDFITFDKKYPFMLFEVFRFREAGGPPGGEPFGVYWIAVADSVEAVFPDGTRSSFHAGLKVADNLLLRPADVIRLSARNYQSGVISERMLRLQDVANDFSDLSRRDLVLNWLKSGGVNYRPDRRIEVKDVIDGQEISNYAGLQLTPAEAAAMAEGIRADEAGSAKAVFQRLNTHFPQVPRAWKVAQSEQLCEGLCRNLTATETRGGTVHIGRGAVEFLTRHKFLLPDFFADSAKCTMLHPWMTQCFLFRLGRPEPGGTGQLGFCWLLEGDEFEIIFPNGDRHNSRTGLKVLPESSLSDDSKWIVVKGRQRELGVWVEIRFNRSNVADWEAFKGVAENWLLYHGIHRERGERPRSGQFFDGEKVRHFPFLFVNATDFSKNPRQYGKYNLITEPAGLSKEKVEELDEHFKLEYNADYAYLYRNMMAGVCLYADKEKDETNYVPVVDYEIEKVQKFVEDSPQYSFRIAKELLLRMRIEHSPMPIALVRDAPLEKYATGLKARRRLKIGTEEVSIGSPKFWRLLRDSDSTLPQGALNELKKIIRDPSTAERVYHAWKAEDWEEFWTLFLGIGLKPDQVCRNFRKIVHISDLHIGKNFQSEFHEATVKLVDALIAHYTDPKPLVVITGDIVDSGRDSLYDQAQAELKKLTDAGFTIIPLPGNHDYSLAVDISEVNQIPFVADWYKEEFDYRSDRVSGLTLDQRAVDRYGKLAQNYLPEWKQGQAANYIESYLKPESGINLIVLDSNDPQPGAFLSYNDRSDDWSKIGGRYIRLARGVLSTEQIEQLRWLMGLHLDKRAIVGLHNWLDYYPFDTDSKLPTSQGAKPFYSYEQQLAKLVLEEGSRTGYDGTRTKCCGPKEDESCFHCRLCSLFQLIAEKQTDQAALNSLYTFMEGYGARHCIRGIAHDPDRDYVPIPMPPRYLSRQVLEDFPKYSQNPQIVPGFMIDKDLEITHIREIPKSSIDKLMNDYDEDLYACLDNAFMLMVGHRHRRHFQRIAEKAKSSFGKFQFELSGLWSLRDSLIQRNGRDKDAARRKIGDFLRGVSLFSDVLKKNGTEPARHAEIAIERIASIVMDCNLSASEWPGADDNSHCRLSKPELPVGGFLQFYSECEDSAKNRSWSEITIDLRNGAVTREYHEVK